MRFGRVAPVFGSAFAAAFFAVFLAAGFLAGSLFAGVPAVEASGAADPQAVEAVRLINGVRTSAGKSALRVDPYLAGKATDGSIPCPDDSSRSIAGRTKDFAAYGQMSHYLRLCGASGYDESTVLFITTMQKWGYVSDGEILTYNRGYGAGKYLFKYGKYAGWTYSTTAHAVGGWLGDTPHRNIIMGSYDRIGCGAWLGGSTYYYACEFSRGGPSPNGLQAPPTRSPFPDPLPGATAAPTAKPKATAVPRSTSVPSPSPLPDSTLTGTPTAAATFTPTAESTAAATFTPTADSTGSPSSPGSPAFQIVGGATDGGATDGGAGPADEPGAVSGGSGGSGYYGTLILLVLVALAGAGIGGAALVVQARRLAPSQGEQRHSGDDADDAAPLAQ